MPGGKVLIFYTENEGKKNENVNFKLVEIEAEWYIHNIILLSIKGFKSNIKVNND